MRSLFFSDTGGQGCAAENNGVPVLCGLGGGSGTGAHFPRAASFLARASEISLQKCPGRARFSALFSAILVNVILRHVCARPAARGAAMKKAFWQLTSMGMFFGACRGAYLIARS